MNGKSWTPEEDTQLRDLYPHKTSSEIALALGRNSGSVESRAKKLGIKKDLTYKRSFDRNDSWLEEEDSILTEKYGVENNVELSKLINKSVSSIRNRAIQLSLKKESFYWTPNEELYLIKNYYSDGVAGVASDLDRTKWAVTDKAKRLRAAGLLKRES